MAEEKSLSPEARRALTERDIPPAVMDIERGHVRRFAEAIGDDSDRWADVAPPTFLRAMLSELPSAPELEAFPQMLDGGSDWEYGEPVRVGDTITAVTRFASVNQRNIGVGPAVFLQIETRYTNQRGDWVATQKNTLIRY
ncbi:MAG: MaoC family dehydratase N-terminal domain-containing protein [Chloroflexota bacterium]|nr:MaoC family dehydratase N-terminal domain-containing protein [Chloroflexota bacterium]MDE2969514.1 MaoC family dehydratase N-terminal domain-containing protein [Chloroflexota bacterium]